MVEASIEKGCYMLPIVPVILAGGSGTRLWPLSRKSYPKQFLPLFGENTLFQQACLRAKAISDEPLLIVSNDQHRFIVSEQLRLLGIEDSRILLEPSGKNTAPAIALAAEYLKQDGKDATMLILSADHYIPDVEALLNAVNNANIFASKNHLVTFGVTPDSPHTGYGYIKKGRCMDEGEVYVVDEFVEKPTSEKAKEYIDSGDYQWNSGIFLLGVNTFLDELKTHSLPIAQSIESSMRDFTLDMGFIRPEKKSFKFCPEDSIDYAIMEKTNNAITVELDTHWSDLGSWSSLWDANSKDTENNVFFGDVMNINGQSNYVYSQDKFTAVIGVSDLVVIDTHDALLISHKDSVQEIKTVVNHLKKDAPHLTQHHRQVLRPWGSYDSIDQGERYQVKRICVNPGAKLSLQMHHHRAEHWIVVSGSAKVTVGENNLLLSENESVYIPIGETHCLENPGKIPLELIEVQSGSYLGEDDIIRFEDKYGRE
ncbi:MAG: mannose-1-phosphate guanylyltransferase/mannose-6-phosphate isomerase [Cellvibrionales bacterium]|nr:mannose-1-phosphate guanylyltransferase/mannose-6-phosphate isomerase [Cellvibrionales bacterium]